MKKKKMIFTASALLLLASFAFANAETNGQPFLALKEAINNLQSQIDNLSSQISDFNTGGVHRKVITGTFPSSIPSPLDVDDDKVVTKETFDTYSGKTVIDYEYYKMITVSEIDTSEMPQVSMYLKETDEDRNAVLGDDIWESYYDSGTIFVKDGILYLKYGYGRDEANVNYEVAGKEYKIVVVY